MKTFLALLIVGFALPAFSATTNSELSVSIAVPYAPNRLAAFGKHSDTNDTRVLCRSWDKNFHVVLRNVSNKSQNIWQDSNSWGYDALTFEVMDESGKKWVTKKILASFDQNGPMFWTLKPNESLVIDVSFADDQKSDWQKWKGFPHNQTVSMQAIFEIRKDAWSQKYSVWTGRGASEWKNFFFAD